MVGQVVYLSEHRTERQDYRENPDRDHRMPALERAWSTNPAPFFISIK